MPTSNLQDLLEVGMAMIALSEDLDVERSRAKVLRGRLSKMTDAEKRFVRRALSLTSGGWADGASRLWDAAR
jgi:hypothetical protein